MSRLSSWLRRRLLPPPRPEDLARSLTRGPDGGAYRPLDRYRDYRRVFLASAEGRRVLSDILDHCRVWKPLLAPGENPEGSHAQARRDGARNVGLMILHTMNFEPPGDDRPAQTNRGE